MHLDDDGVHLGERRLVLVHDQVGALGDDVQVVVGDQRGDLDDDVPGRVQAGHLEIHPHQHGRKTTQRVTVARNGRSGDPRQARSHRDAAARRDTTEGIEVFMLRRTNGRRVRRWHVRVPRAARSTKPTARATTGYVVAAIRECYEEAGVLLAVDANGHMVTDGHPALAHRQAVYDGTVDLRHLCAEHGLTPAIDASGVGEPLDHPGRRIAAPLRHPLLRRRRSAWPNVAPRRQRDHRQQWVRPADALGPRTNAAS